MSILQVNLYEASNGGLYLHREGDSQVYDFTGIWENGGFQEDARQVSAGTMPALQEIMKPVQLLDDLGEPVATWYGPGVFMLNREPGANGRRYIGAFLVDTPKMTHDDGGGVVGRHKPPGHRQAAGPVINIRRGKPLSFICFSLFLTIRSQTKTDTCSGMKAASTQYRDPRFSFPSVDARPTFAALANISQTG